MEFREFDEFDEMTDAEVLRDYDLEELEEMLEAAEEDGDAIVHRLRRLVSERRSSRKQTTKGA